MSKDTKVIVVVMLTLAAVSCLGGGPSGHRYATHTTQTEVTA